MRTSADTRRFVRCFEVLKLSQKEHSNNTSVAAFVPNRALFVTFFIL
jgi:hypothetical protein